MEKLSGILPPSARIVNVDLKASGTARSGMPSFGRPQLELTGPARRTAPETLQVGRPGPFKPDEVGQIEKDFFVGKGKVSAEVSVPKMPLGPDEDLNPSTVGKISGVKAPASDAVVDEMDLPQVGSQLNVVA